MLALMHVMYYIYVLIYCTIKGNTAILIITFLTSCTFMTTIHL